MYVQMHTQLMCSLFCNRDEINFFQNESENTRKISFQNVKALWKFLKGEN